MVDEWLDDDATGQPSASRAAIEEEARSRSVLLKWQPARALRLLSTLLLVVCGFLMVGVVAVDVHACARAFAALDPAWLPSAENWADLRRYAAIEIAAAALDVIAMALFVVFVAGIVRRRSLFVRFHAILLLGMSIATAVRSFIGLLTPMLGTVSFPLDAYPEILVAPTLDWHQLLFAVMLAALAGVFEYGRLLQEESESFV